MDRERGKADDICVPAAAAVYTGKPIVDESGGGGNLTCMSVSFKGRQHLVCVNYVCVCVFTTRKDKSPALSPGD